MTTAEDSLPVSGTVEAMVKEEKPSAHKFAVVAQSPTVTSERGEDPPASASRSAGSERGATTGGWNWP